MVSLQEQVRAAGFFIALASLVLLAITVLLALWGIRRGLLPLQNLTAQAAAVSAQTWDFRVPEEALQSEELRPLIEAMVSLFNVPCEWPPDGLRGPHHRRIVRPPLPTPGSGLSGQAAARGRTSALMRAAAASSAMARSYFACRFIHI